MSWHKDRFVEDKRKTECSCVVCGKKYWLPKSKADKYITCGKDCNSAMHKENKEKRKRKCLTCEKEFYPRKSQIDNGIGIFCSQKCNVNSINALHSEKSREKSTLSFKKAIENGSYVPARGEESKRWLGGKVASSKRRIESGKANALLVEYRKNNPEKVREWAASRGRRKYGRLPKGTITRLLLLQKNRCAICGKQVNGNYHVDHIMPLSKGGLHEKENIQVLCPKCNVRKAAKDPIKYMQEIGRLL